MRVFTKEKRSEARILTAAFGGNVKPLCAIQLKLNNAIIMDVDGRNNHTTTK